MTPAPEAGPALVVGLPAMDAFTCALWPRGIWPLTPSMAAFQPSFEVSAAGALNQRSRAPA